MKQHLPPPHITLSPEIIREWQIKIEYSSKRADREAVVAKIFQLGADIELEACCEWLVANDWKAVQKHLRDARRPKQPSLKEQALDSWDRLRNEAWCEEIDFDLDLIRRALESLPE